MLKIGITEAGDAALHMKEWVAKVSGCDGIVLITKNLTGGLQEKIMELYTSGYKNIVVHATCTGHGGSMIEPNVPNYCTQLEHFFELVAGGFPVTHMVLRLDPIIPSTEGLAVAGDVLEEFCRLKTANHVLSKVRCRVSIVDDYPHVKERFTKSNLATLYPYDSKYPSWSQMRDVAELLSRFREEFVFETCAEDGLTSALIKKGMSDGPVGCVSEKELALFRLEPDPQMTVNPQSRCGCHCLSCKTELLSNKKRCAHKCLYCYWKD